MGHDSTQQAIITTKISAELYHAQQITRSLSISSKNLRVMAKRIGQNALGLSVLASFYDECSHETISLANQVEQLTISSALLAVQDWRANLFEQELKKSCRLMSKEQIPSIVLRLLARVKNREMESQDKRLKFNSKLHDLLLEMQKNIRSIAVIAVNSKIEAPNTGEHSATLLDMAQNVEHMIDRILKHISTALKYLSLGY